MADGTVDFWREIGRDRFEKTPPNQLGEAVASLTRAAAGKSAGDAEKGALAGFLDALTAMSDASLRALGMQIKYAERQARKPGVAVELSSGARATVVLPR